VSQVDPAAVHAARVVGARAVVFDDSEHERLVAGLTHRFADVVCTPSGFDRDVPNQRRYDGFHELAYLHPNRFTPDPAALQRHGVDPESSYAVVRFVAWDAHHDLGRRGFSPAGKQQLVERLDEHGTVYVTAEGEPRRRWADPLPVEAIHDLLAFADCYVGDSQTMATEAAVLGTPAVRTSAFVGDDDMSNFRELETEYGLLQSFADEDAASTAPSRSSRNRHVRGPGPPSDTPSRANRSPIDAEFMRRLFEELPDGTVRPVVCRCEGEFAGGKILLELGDQAIDWISVADRDVDIPVTDLVDWWYITNAVDRGSNPTTSPVRTIPGSAGIKPSSRRIWRRTTGRNGDPGRRWRRRSSTENSGEASGRPPRSSESLPRNDWRLRNQPSSQTVSAPVALMSTQASSYVNETVSAVSAASRSASSASPSR